MSINTSAVPAYQTVVRTPSESSQSNGAAPAASAAAREMELAHQLEARLTNELSRIRQQINSEGSGALDKIGTRLDIRA